MSWNSSIGKGLEKNENMPYNLCIISVALGCAAIERTEKHEKD